MRLTHDPEADAAYVTLVHTIGPGEAAQQIHSITTPGGRGEIVLDFDAGGHMLGIEILNASAVLSAEVLAAAERPA